MKKYTIKILLSFMIFSFGSLAHSHEYLSNDETIIQIATSRAAEELPCQSTAFLYNSSSTGQYRSGNAVLLNPTTAITAAHVVSDWSPGQYPCYLNPNTNALIINEKFAEIDSIIIHPEYNLRLIPDKNLGYYSTNFSTYTYSELIKKATKTVDGKKYKEEGPDLAIIKLKTPINLPSEAILSPLPKVYDKLSAFNPSYGIIKLNNDKVISLNEGHTSTTTVRHLGITSCVYDEECKTYYEKYQISGSPQEKYIRTETHHLLQTKCTFGASGSPLVCRNREKKYFIAAIQSCIFNVNIPGSEDVFAYSVFTSVTPYRDWISSHLNHPCY